MCAQLLLTAYEFRRGFCTLVLSFHLFFIICHPYIPLHRRNDFLYLFYPSLTVPSKTMLEYRCKKEMLIPQHAGIELGPHRYDATLQTSTLCYTHLSNSAHTMLNFITRVRGRSRRGTLSKMASFIVDSCRDQRFSLETWNGSKNDRLGSMHTSDHRRSVWYKN